MGGKPIIKIKNKSGNWYSSLNFLHKSSKGLDIKTVEAIAESEISVFAKATPSKTGKTAASWFCTVEEVSHGYKINYCNSNIQNGVNIAIMVDIGHATPNGRWYSGAHYLDKTAEKVNDDLLIKFMEALDNNE